MNVVGVTEVDSVWPLVIDGIVTSLKKPHPASVEISPGEVWSNCRSGSWVMILAVDDEQKIAGITVWRFAKNDYFDCVLMQGSRLRDWLAPLVTAAVAIGKAHDCIGLCATGRPEFEHVFRKSLGSAKVVSHTYALEF